MTVDHYDEELSAPPGLEDPPGLSQSQFKFTPKTPKTPLRLRQPQEPREIQRDEYDVSQEDCQTFADTYQRLDEENPLS